MQNDDARSLSSEAQEALRKRAVNAVMDGLTHQEAAEKFGVARGTVTRWVSEYRERGEQALDRKAQGRPAQPRLQGHQAATIVRLITERCPDQLKLPFALWTREAVAQLIEQRFGICLSVWTVGRYLRRWGMSPQKPAHRAFEQDDEAVAQWLDEVYPEIRRRAQREGAQIHWGDEMGLRSDHQAGTTWGVKGQTPVVAGTGQRFRANVISSITNRGSLRFRVFTGRFTADVFIDFLKRLVRASPRKVYLIVDRHPTHRAKKVKRWLAKHSAKIELFYLPPYSPQRNPDEYLNQDVKANAVGRYRARNISELVDNIRSYLRSTQRRPRVVQRFFHAGPVQYAAA